MKKRFSIKDVLLILLILAPFAWAGISNFGPIMVDQIESADTYLFTGKNTSGTQKIQIDTSGNIDSEGTLDVAEGNFVVDSSGNITTAGGTTTLGYLEFGLDDFTQVWTGSQVNFNLTNVNPRIGTVAKSEPMYANGKRADYPYLKADAVSSAIVWPQYHPLDRKDPENAFHWALPGDQVRASYAGSDTGAPRDLLSPIQVAFKVPHKYSSGGAMVLTMHQRSGRSTNVTAARAKIAYKYYMTTPGNYWSDSQGVGTQYANVGTAGYLLSPTEVTCSVSSSDMDIEPDKWLVFQYARVRDESVVDNLAHLAARFYFNPKH